MSTYKAGVLYVGVQKVRYQCQSKHWPQKHAVPAAVFPDMRPLWHRAPGSLLARLRMERGLAPASLVRRYCLRQQYAVASSFWQCRLIHCFAADWHAAGGGLTLGVSKADTVMVLNTEAALEQFKRDTDFKLGAGLSVDCE